MAAKGLRISPVDEFGLSKPVLDDVQPIPAKQLNPMPPVRLKPMPIYNGPCAHMPPLEQVDEPPQGHDGWVKTIQVFETRIREIRQAKAELEPGAQRLQLHMLADTFERDPTFVAARQNLANEVAAAEQKIAALKAAEEAAAERKRLDTIRFAPREAARARVAALTAKYAELAPRLQAAEVGAAEAERQRVEVGGPLLKGAVNATRGRAAQMAAEEAKLLAETEMLRANIDKASRMGQELETSNAFLAKSRAELERTVAAASEDKVDLRQRLEALLEKQSAFSASASAQSAALQNEAEMLRRRLSADLRATFDLQQRCATLEAEKTSLQQDLAKADAGFERKFAKIFGLLPNSVKETNISKHIVDTSECEQTAACSVRPWPSTSPISSDQQR